MVDIVGDWGLWVLQEVRCGERCRRLRCGGCCRRFKCGEAAGG